MATFVRSILRSIEPFYPATAEEQGRLQRWFLGDAESAIYDTTGADVSDSELVRETSKRVDAIQNELQQTTYTVSEIDRHVLRCRRDVNELVADFGENIAKECNQKVDAKVAELHKKMEAFERTLQRSCDQAAQHADARMQELVGKHNAEVQDLNDHLREEIAEIEKIVGEKATRAEVAALSTENSASKKRLENLQKKNNVLHEKRGQEIVQVMRSQKTLDGWIKVVRKEQDAAHLGSQAEARARAALDQRLRSLEKQRREKQVSSQGLISVPQNSYSPRTLQSAEYLQQKSKIEELSKRLESYESRLKELEEPPAPTPAPPPARTGPCECCEEVLRDVNKRLEKIEEASAAKKLESLKCHFKAYEKAADAHFESYKKYANTRYEALEGKFEKLAGLMKEPSTPAVDWQTVARLETLEEDRRWNGRVRQLETFGVATPEPVLKHMELLEAKLGLPLYERGFSLPNTVARSRIAWAWNALRNSARANTHGVAGTATTAPGPQSVPQQSLPQPAVYQQQISQPLGAQTGPPPQQALVQPAINQQEASDPMDAQPEAPPQQTSQVEMISEPAVHPEATSQRSEPKVDPQTIAEEEMTLQETTEMELVGHKGSPEPTNPEIPVQQPVTTDTKSTSSPEQLGRPASQPLYGTDASPAYTTVLGIQSTPMQSVPQTTATSSGTGFSMTKGLTQQRSTPFASNPLARYTPTKPSPLRSIQLPDAKDITTATPSQQAEASGPSSSFSNYKPAQSSPTISGVLSIQPISRAGADATSTTLTSPAETQAHSTAAPGPSKAEEDESHPSTAPTSGNDIRKIKPKPKGRLAKMTDEQRNAVRTEMQKPASDSRQEPSGSVNPAPIFPAWVKSTAPETSTSATEAPAASTSSNDREDEVDYGNSDDENPTPFSTAAVAKNVTWASGKTARRYSTQWLKIWRSHVVSERNLRAFAKSCGFGDEADKWVAIVGNANADTSPPALLSQANIGVTRQLYSADDVEEIAKAFFEVCLVQSESFVKAIEKFDPFEVGNYHAKFLAAFKDYLKANPADSF
ncbi:hypothetical protein VPNG_03004 [Cytospora leucostoma]|uniref:Uncharacterized protein n=1 Tax=Cytospora leucostoma TaxID=1230097 RepID=A0A423XGA9_9PEZI|nr:hypothetical protein VPNG_03004 [Cytospora leucostoma]